MLRNIVGDSYNRPEGANRDDHPTEGTDPQHPRHHGQEPRLNPRDADAPQAGDAMPVPDIQTQDIPSHVSVYASSLRLHSFLNSLFGPVDGDGMSPLARFFNNGPGAGGDYVYSQSELDRIISQLMEQHQGNAPPPAQKEDIARLPRIKVTQAMVDDAVDCAVCKEDLLLDEEVTVLPCKHSYHFDCVSKWLEEHDVSPCCSPMSTEVHILTPVRLVPYVGIQSLHPRTVSSGRTTNGNPHRPVVAEAAGVVLVVGDLAAHFPVASHTTAACSARVPLRLGPRDKDLPRHQVQKIRIKIPRTTPTELNLLQPAASLQDSRAVSPTTTTKRTGTGTGTGTGIRTRTSRTRTEMAVVEMAPALVLSRISSDEGTVRHCIAYF